MSSTLATQTTSTTQSPTTSSPPTSSTSSSSSNNNNNNDSSVAGYYFVFVALVLCVLGAAGFLFLRRRRRLLRNIPGARHDTWNRPGLTVTPADNRWLGRWRSAEMSREEGLNEYGEAPPAYVPKSDEEAGRTRGQNATQPDVAVPMQTLSGDAAGFKLPDYSETVAEVPQSTGRTAPSSSRHST